MALIDGGYWLRIASRRPAPVSKWSSTRLWPRTNSQLERIDHDGKIHGRVLLANSESEALTLKCED